MAYDISNGDDIDDYDENDADEDGVPGVLCTVRVKRTVSMCLRYRTLSKNTMQIDEKL